jgi:hypothetical protein
MEPEGSLPCSQEHATDPYLERDEPSPYLPPNFREVIVILSSYLGINLGLPTGVFL